MISETVLLNGTKEHPACPECGEWLSREPCPICRQHFLPGQTAECVEENNARYHYHKECYENATADGVKER